MTGHISNWFRSTFGLTALGAVLLWAALPALDLWPLAWLAPVAWVSLIRRPTLPALDVEMPPWLTRYFGTRAIAIWLWLGLSVWLLLSMPLCGYFHEFKFKHGFAAADSAYWAAGIAILWGLAVVHRTRPYLSMWLVGFFFWLAVLQWLRLPHWATSVGWWAMAGYFAFYFPVFVALARVAVHRCRVPSWIAAPLVWTGLEWARAHLLTGMTMASLGHTQYRWTQLIQISDLVGAYGVSFLIMLVAACLERMLPVNGTTQVPRRLVWWPAAIAAAALAGALFYGHVRMTDVALEPGPRVALIQGSFDIQLGAEEGTGQHIMDDYFRRTLAAVRDSRKDPLDLVIWPETVFAPLWVTSSDHPPKPDTCSKMSDSEFRTRLDDWVRGTRAELLKCARTVGVPMIVGIDREYVSERGDEIFNTAVFIRPDSQDIEWYDKMHLVLFGEYTPLIDKLPWLQHLTPLCTSAHEGDRPVAFLLQYKDRSAGKPVSREVCIAPNICYESVLPHLIREQIVTLQAAGHDPEILVNLTNDGWFWGSNELEQHLACGVFRAVECRRPFLIAANTGISAWIDSFGVLHERGPIRASKTIVADVQLDHRRSLYVAWGDWFAAGCLSLALVAGVIGRIVGKRREDWTYKTHETCKSHNVLPRHPPP